MLMVIDDVTKQQSYFWIYEAGPSAFRIYRRVHGGEARVLITCESQAEAERLITIPAKRATLITFH